LKNGVVNPRIPEMVNNILWYTRVGDKVAEFLKGRKTCIKVKDKELCEINGRVIKVNSSSDVMKIASTYNLPVSFLGSTDVLIGDLKLVTPTWVIGFRSKDYWRLGLDTAWLIAKFLVDNGIEKSVYIAYIGKGFEVRINERVLSGIDDSSKVSFSIVEYVLRKLKLKLQRIVYASHGRIYVKNGVVDRMLYAPLTLLSSSETVIYFKIDEVEEFDLSWASTNSPKHDDKWREYDKNEVLEIANKALMEVKDENPTVIKIKRPVSWKNIERFQVMGLMQAARYYLLKGDLDKAKSFGYNRAVFYAWAKHYGGRLRYYRQPSKIGQESISVSGATKNRTWRQATILGEPVTISPRGWYGMGGEEHLPRHYDENIAKKIEIVIPYEIAWKATLEYLKKFPREVLEDQQKFFRIVYQPVRDSFIEDVLLNRSPRKIVKIEEGKQVRKSAEQHVAKPFRSLEEFMKDKKS